MDAISDTASDLPHMLPRPETFAAAADALGISNDSQVLPCTSTTFEASTSQLHEAAHEWRDECVLYMVQCAR